MNDPLPETFTIPEPEVARRLGLALDDVRSRRGQKGVDWSSNGRPHRVFWTEAAVAALAAVVSPAVATKSRAPYALLPERYPLVVVQLTRTRMPNTRIVIGRVEGGNSFDPLVTVVVGVDRARWFQPGQRVRARKAEGGTYTFEGNPDRPEKGRVWPRTPGRW